VRVWGVILCASSIAALGCGSGSGSVVTDCDGGCWHPTPEDEAFLDALCTRIEGCCVINEITSAPDVERCKGQLRRAGISRDPSLREMCLAQLDVLASGGRNCLPEIWNLGDPCVRVLYEPSGPQPPGQRCTSGADCAGAAGTVTLCSPDPSTDLSSALCLRLARGKAGDHTCLGTVSATGVIISAAFFQPTWTMPPISTGVVCERRANLYCQPSDDPASRICLPLAPDGDPCAGWMICASDSCMTASGSEWFGGDPGTCAQQVSTGQRCGGAGLHPICDDASYCDRTGSTDSTGTCAAKLPAGSACDADDMCASNNCDTNACSMQTDAQSLAVFGFCARI
jgi:hypothetical protein